MLRKLLALLVFVAGVVVAGAASPADATCTPGYVALKPKPTVQLPQCYPPQQ